MHPVEKYIRSIPDFPEPGIIFRDITTVTQSPVGLKLAIDGMRDLIKDISFINHIYYTYNTKSIVYVINVYYAKDVYNKYNSWHVLNDILVLLLLWT